MNLKHVAAAALLAVGAASAQAVTVNLNPNLGAVGSAEETIGGFGLLDRGSFSYLYNFTLDSTSNLSGDLDVLWGGISFTGVSIGGASAALSPSNSFSFADLAAGTYTMVVNLRSTTWSHGWAGSVMAQTVPEPQSVLMLLAGLGVMGAMAARRRRFQ